LFIRTKKLRSPLLVFAHTDRDDLATSSGQISTPAWVIIRARVRVAAHGPLRGPIGRIGASVGNATIRESVI
jgi:hypothetical protein